MLNCTSTAPVAGGGRTGMMILSLGFSEATGGCGDVQVGTDWKGGPLCCLGIGSFTVRPDWR